MSAARMERDMDASQFALWLQGFAELNAEPPTKEQWQSIREHLQLVFTKVTPPVKVVEPKNEVDASKNKDLKRLLEKFKRDQGFQPWPPTPSYFPPYYLGDKLPPGTIIC
jgi:hypothetical protein